MATQDDADKNTQNTGLESLRLAVQMGYSKYGMVDGFGDVFTSETGVNTTASTNEQYNAIQDYYTSAAAASDAGTDFYDSSATGVTLTTNGSAQTHIPTIDSPYSDNSSIAIDFSVASQYITAPNSTAYSTLGGGDFTVEAWVKFDNLTGVQGIVAQSGGGGSNFSYVMSSSGTALRWTTDTDGSGSGTTSISGGTLSTDTWHHCAAVQDSGTFRIYLDGTQVATGTDVMHAGTSVTSIGAYSDGSSSLTGHVVDARIIKGTCLYPDGTTFTPPTTSPTFSSEGLYVWGSTSSGNIEDRAGNTLTLNGNVSVDASPYGTEDPIILLDGTGDYLSYADLDVSGNFSFSMWFRCDDLGTSRGLWAQEDVGTDRSFYIARNASNQLEFRYSTDGTSFTTLTSSGTFDKNVWHYLVVSYDGSDIKIDVDGSNQNTTNVGSITLFDSSSTVVVGARTSAGADSFDGTICDPRFFTSAIAVTSPTEKPTPTTEALFIEHGTGPVNMTLIGASQTADSAPTTARGIVLYDPVDSATLNTDATLELSMDGGSTYSTAFTLTKNSDYDANVEIIETNNLTLDSTSGTSIVYRLKTLNSKEIRIHGVYFQWA